MDFIIRNDIIRLMRLRTIIFASFLFLSGCAHLEEAGKEIWGTSMAHLESARASGESTQVSLPLDKCFKKTETLLVASKAVVYLKDKDKKYLAAMNFQGHVDTTQVGIFFTKSGDDLTKVEVSSLSPQLVRQVSEFLFPKLKEKGDENEKKV